MRNNEFVSTDIYWSGRFFYTLHEYRSCWLYNLEQEECTIYIKLSKRWKINSWLFYWLPICRHPGSLPGGSEFKDQFNLFYIKVLFNMNYVYSSNYLYMKLTKKDSLMISLHKETNLDNKKNKWMPKVWTSKPGWQDLLMECLYDPLFLQRASTRCLIKSIVCLINMGNIHGYIM